MHRNRIRPFYPGAAQVVLNCRRSVATLPGLPQSISSHFGASLCTMSLHALQQLGQGGICNDRLRLERRSKLPTKKSLDRERARLAERAKEHRKRIYSFLGFLITAFGVYTGAISLLTRISVDLQSSLDPSNALATPFVVTNEGNLDLHKVEYACVFIHVKFASGSE